jgi:putative lysine transport system permease protein
MTFFETIVKIVEKYWKQLLLGMGNTLLIALVSTLIGLLIGILIGVIRTVPYSKNPIVRAFQKFVNFLLVCYIEIFRGTPMMVQAMVIYWGYAFATGGNTLPLLPSALFIVSINTGAYIAEIVRGGIISIDKGQFEGAKSVGMNHWQTMIHVIIPQVIRNILPAVGNEFVINIKDTSVLNVIGVVELFYQSQIIQKATWQTFPVYAITCVIYFIMTFTVTRILRLLERLLDGKGNYTICGSQSDPNAQIKVRGEAHE